MSATDLSFSIHAERQFAELEASYSLERSGENNHLTNQDRIFWEDWNDIPCVVLLGEPGSGKTTEFKYQCNKLRNTEEFVFESNWQDWMAGDNLEETLNDKDKFKDALSSENTIWWFLDALDELHLKDQNAFTVVRKKLKSIGENVLKRVRLRISCRSRDWRTTEKEKLSSIFPIKKSDYANKNEDDDPISVVIVQLLPLDDKAIHDLSYDKLNTEIDTEKFIHILRNLHIIALAGHPFLLVQLLLQYKNNFILGKNRTQLYKWSIKRLVIELNEERKPSTTPEQRIEISKLLAIHSVLSSKVNIIVPDTDSSNEMMLDATECLSYFDKGQNWNIGTSEILETLNTALFRKDQKGFSFSHRSFAEYLVADYLSDMDGLLLTGIKSLIYIESSTCIPTQLRETAAWLAGLNKDFRTWLIKRDPVTAVDGDVILYTPTEREKLINILAKRFEDRVWQCEFNQFGDLARQLESYGILASLLNKDKSRYVRQMAMDMIDSAEVEELFPDLQRIALDKEETPSLRLKVIKILVTRAPDLYAKKLLPLLELSPEEDPSDEIAGIVLYYLYPEYLTTDQILVAIRSPHYDSMFSSYMRFWNELFIQRIPDSPDDRKVALDYFSKILVDGKSQRRHLADINGLIAKAFEKLIIKELGVSPCNLNRLGSWLVKWSSFENRKHSDLMCLLTKIPGLGSGLLNWSLSHSRNEQDFFTCLNLFDGGSYCIQGGTVYPVDESNRKIEDVIMIRKEDGFRASLFHPNDLNSWTKLCIDNANNQSIGEHLFVELVSVLLRYPDFIQLEVIEELALASPNYQNYWDSQRITDLGSEDAKRSHDSGKMEAQSRKIKAIFAKNQSEYLGWYYRKHHEKMEILDREVKVITEVQKNIQVLHDGDLLSLINVIKMVVTECHRPKSEILNLLGNRFGANVAGAVQIGITQALMKSFDDVSIYKPSSLPGEHQLCGLKIIDWGLQEWFDNWYRSGCDNLQILNKDQICYLVNRISDPLATYEMCILLESIWDNHQDVVLRWIDENIRNRRNRRSSHYVKVMLLLWSMNRGQDIIWQTLARILDTEYEAVAIRDFSIWYHLNRRYPPLLDMNLLEKLTIYLLEHGLPRNVEARRSAIKILTPQFQGNRRDSIMTLLQSTVQEECLSSHQKIEPSAVVALSAWWEMAPSEAYKYLKSAAWLPLLNGSETENVTTPYVIISFIHNLSSTFDKKLSNTVPWNCYAELLPLLYEQHKPSLRQELGDKYEFVKHERVINSCRKQLIEHLINAPEAKSWLSEWKDDSYYGYDCDWFSELHTEIERRQADKDWVPLESKEIKEIINKRTIPIRNAGNLSELLNYVIASELVSVFSSPASLAPFLWEGTKKDGRKPPKDENKWEKELQAVIYAKLYLILKNYPVIATRESEVRDAKKPDILVSCILKDGTKVNVPIEIKWAKHDKVWIAPKEQILKQYMLEQDVSHAIYIVGWGGIDHLYSRQPGRRKKPENIKEFQEQLQNYTDSQLDGTGKTITVHVLDITV